MGCEHAAFPPEGSGIARWSSSLTVAGQ